MAGLMDGMGYDGMTRHQRAARQRATVVPDDTFLRGPELKEGPGMMPRNYVADWLRERGLYSLAGRINDGDMFANGHQAGALGNLLASYGYPTPAQRHWSDNMRPGDL